MNVMEKEEINNEKATNVSTRLPINAPFRKLCKR